MIEQVDGRHYAGTYQHWDWVRDVLENDYLIGCGTKYVCRWRQKNGLVDLQKAETYYLKKLEQGRWAPRQADQRKRDLTERLILEYAMGPREAIILHRSAQFLLCEALAELRLLINTAGAY